MVDVKNSSVRTARRGDWRPQTKPQSLMSARLGLRQRGAQLILLWEVLWRAFWQPVAIGGLFAALTLLDALPLLGGWAHLAVLLALIAAFTIAAIRGVRTLELPTQTQARRRLERDNHLDHRPLTMLEDNLAAGQGEAGSEYLWQAHVDQTLGSLGRLRVGAPKPGLARRDPVALRYAVLLLLFVGAVIGYRDLSDRFARSAVPDISLGADGATAGLELWVTPPDYTGLAPIFISGGRAGPEKSEDIILVPAGSKIVAQVHDAGGAPELSFGGHNWVLEALDDRSWAIEFDVFLEGVGDLPLETEIILKQDGRQIGRWPAAYIADLAPEIEFVAAEEEESEGARGKAFSVRYAATDDFGVTELVARIWRIDQPGRGFDLTLPMPRGSNGLPISVSQDLTAHPWAGLPVDVKLEARDALGQLGTTQYMAILLPERVFLHPVARVIAASRKILIRDPAQRLDIAHALGRLADRRESYGNDVAVFLALTAAGTRLTRNPPPMVPWRSYSLVNQDSAIGEPVIIEVMDLLWETALRVEDGGMSTAQRELADLQRQIQEALEDGASDERVAELMDQLSEALDRLFEAAAEQLRQALENGELPQLNPDNLALGQQDLQDMIDRARQLAEMGADEAAADLLSQLQQMLDGMRAGTQLGNLQQQQGESQAQQLMQDLQGIIGDQQELLDETFQRNQDGKREQEGEDQADREGAGRQEDLRGRLGEFMRELGDALGELPGELGEAEGAMRRSTEEFAQGRPGQSIGPQENALELLRQGGQAAAQALAEQGQNQGQGQGQGLVFGFGQPPGQRGSRQPGTDPFGRELDGNRGFSRDDVDVPDEGDIQRAREILEELRERAGDRGRTQDELDYIERLLRRF